MSFAHHVLITDITVVFPYTSNVGDCIMLPGCGHWLLLIGSISLRNNSTKPPIEALLSMPKKNHPSFYFIFLTNRNMGLLGFTGFTYRPRVWALYISRIVSCSRHNFSVSLLETTLITLLLASD